MNNDVDECEFISTYSSPVLSSHYNDNAPALRGHDPVNQSARSKIDYCVVTSNATRYWPIIGNMQTRRNGVRENGGKYRNPVVKLQRQSERKSDWTQIDKASRISVHQT